MQEYHECKKSPLFKFEDKRKLYDRERFFEGEADGVLYLGSTNTSGKRQVISLELEAFRYLRPLSKEWLEDNPGMIGIGIPKSLDGLWPKEVRTWSKKFKRPLAFFIVCDSEGMPDAHNYNWEYKQVADGIWAIYFKGKKERIE